MNLLNTSQIKNLLKSYGIQPKKRLGQHFLINKKVLENIIKAADLSKNDTVIEVGPGIGTFTTEFCKKVKKVIAIEKDSKMTEILKKTCVGFKNLEIINKDILKTQISKLKSQNYKVVANLPFNIASPVIRYFLENKRPPEQLILIIQKEVAEKICAKPGEMNILGISVQFYGKPEILFKINKGSFWPQPKVESAVIKIEVFPKPLFNVDTNKFFNIIKTGFSSKRKKLCNVLSKGLKKSKTEVKNIFIRLNLDLNIRPQELSLNDWYRIYKEIYPTSKF